MNLVACMIVLIGAFTGQDSPLTVTQMLWVNLIMDTFAALSLASLPPSMEVMKNKPRKMTDFIINRPMKWFIIGVSIVFVLVLFGFLQYLKYSPETELSAFSIREFFAHYFTFDPVHASVSPYDLTVFFTFFVFLQFWNLFNAKSFESGHSSFQKIRESKVFFLTILVILVGQVLIVSFGGQMFSVVPLKWQDWLILFGASSLVLWIGEIVHFIHRCTNNQNKRMGLLYNHKNKNDMVVLSEESLENNEGELYTFELLPDDEQETEKETDGKEDADVR